MRENLPGEGTGERSADFNGEKSYDDANLID
jgi:hypothetical protein